MFHSLSWRRTARAPPSVHEKEALLKGDCDGSGPSGGGGNGAEAGGGDQGSGSTVGGSSSPATAPSPSPPAPAGATGLSRRTSSISSALGAAGGAGSGGGGSGGSGSSGGMGRVEGGRDGGGGSGGGGGAGGGGIANVVTVEAGSGDGEEGIVVEVDSVERPRSFRKGSKEDLEGMLLAHSVAAVAAGGVGGGGGSGAGVGGGGADGRDGGQSHGGGGMGGGVGASAAATVDAYLRSFYSSAFLRRTKASSPSSGGLAGGGGPSSSSVGSGHPGGDGADHDRIEGAGSSGLLLGGGGERDGGGKGLGGMATGAAHGEKVASLARAFEKRRVAVLASIRHRTKLSLVLLCPLVVLVMLSATLVSVSRGGGGEPPNQRGGQHKAEDLTSVYPAAAAVLGAAATATGGAARDPAREKYTVMVNTYKRHDMAKDAVRHYANCELVDAIRVVWSENATAPDPERDPAWFSEKKPVVYDTFPTTSLNNRFVPPSGLRTDAVFAVDDDIRVPCQDLDFAYEVWKVSDDSLVGFMPRIHTLNPAALAAASERAALRGSTAAAAVAGAEEDVQAAAEDEERIGGGGSGEEEWRPTLPLFRYNGWWKVWWDGEYSLVLTKAAFLHRDFLQAYTEQMPGRIREYVDENRNCEDIAMQFLASNLTGKPPVFVRGRVTDLGVFKGISTQSWTKLGHMKSRGQCLNDFVDLYGGVMPLVRGRVVAGSASSWVFNRPSSIFEYVSSDMLVGGAGKGTTMHASVRRARLLHLIPLLALMILVIVKLMY